MGDPAAPLVTSANVKSELASRAAACQPLRYFAGRLMRLLRCLGPSLHSRFMSPRTNWRRCGAGRAGDAACLLNYAIAPALYIILAESQLTHFQRALCLPARSRYITPTPRRCIAGNPSRVDQSKISTSLSCAASAHNSAHISLTAILMICSGGPALYAPCIGICMRGAAPLSRAHRLQKLPRVTVLIALIEIYSCLPSTRPDYPIAGLIRLL